MPSRDEILKAFDCINVWSRGLERAPHKPLLVLYALGQLTRDGQNLISFRDLAPKLTELLKEFGPTRTSYHPEYPFWRLQNDGVWIVDDADHLKRRSGQTDIPKRELLNNNVHAHFTDEIATSLQRDPSLLADIALRLLDGHFPTSIHQDILDAVGLELNLTETVTRRKRDPSFRGRILAAYGYSCAVCGFDVRLGSQIMGLEAAHIQWHQAGGPDEESNGLALCSLHHKAFDLGAFTIHPDRVLLVSKQAHGQQSFDDWLLKFHGHPIRPPQRESYLPASAFLDWHEREVFKRPSRELSVVG
ncbi:MAG TPA: restriction endonuclease [Planctomycetaceae bacterium]|nr:restriction endonuclease [Planctomycetaceae bacterium]